MCDSDNRYLVCDYCGQEFMHPYDAKDLEPSDYANEDIGLCIWVAEEKAEVVACAKCCRENDLKFEVLLP